MASITSHDEKRWKVYFYDATKSPKRKARYYKKKSYYKSYGYTKKQVETMAWELEQQHKRNEIDLWDDVVQEGDIRFSEAIELYKRKVKGTIADSSVETYIYNLNLVIEFTGNVYLSRLDNRSIQSFLDSGDFSVSYKKNLLAAINSFCKFVSKAGHQVSIDLTINESRAERKRQSHLRESEWMTKEEFERLLEVAKEFAKKKKRRRHIHQLVDFLLVGFYTGMRKSELLHLKPCWINEDYTIVKIGDRGFTPKSQNPVELMPTIPEARPILKRICEGKDPSLPIFTITFGQLFIFMNDISDLAFGKSKHIKVHSLRHSFIMYCLYKLHIPERMVMQLSRHTSREAFECYVHQDIESVIDFLK